MNHQRDVVRRNDNENANPLEAVNITKALSSHAQPLKTRLDASNRTFLSDKSNGSLKLKTAQVNKTNTESAIKVYVDQPLSTKAEDTQPEQQLDTDTQAHIDHFFNDNQTRYEQDDQDFVGVVPVLPIKVPERLRHLFVKDAGVTSQHLGKRSLQETEDPLQEQVEKKLKFRSQSKSSVSETPLTFDVSDETVNYEREQEKRAKLAMLQTTQSLREEQWNDPMLVAEYAGEIFCNLFDAEPHMLADPSYVIHQQHEMSWRMRGVLVDWIIEIHYLFGLLPETLFLTVNIIDRFLSLRTVALGKLQLVGITSLFIATKFEEMICPSMQDFLFMTDNNVTEEDLIKAERFILQNLDFRLCYPNPLNFLRRICTDDTHCDIHIRTLAKYFMEISCVDHRFISVRPSKIAASALWLSRKMLAKGKWTTNFSKHVGYTPEELKPTVETMLDYLSQTVIHDAFFKKWSSNKFSKASIFVRDWINRYYLS